MAVALISGQLCAAKLAKSEIMLAVLLFGKKYENQAHASNGELPKVTLCKTISLTGVFLVFIDYRKLSEMQTGSSGCVGSQRTLS